MKGNSMKKLIVAVAALGWVGAAFAGDYHKFDKLICSDCHAMHASRQHAFNGTGVDPLYPLALQGVGYDKLLLQNGVNPTCLACHDGQASIPDVLGSAGGGQVNRSAGFLNSPTVGASYTGHTLDTADSPPGYLGSWNAGTEGFNCSNCHAVHGSGAYRNLGLSMYMGSADMSFGTPSNPFASVGPTYNAIAPNAATRASTTFDATKDVTIRVTGRDYLTTNVKLGIGSGNTTAVNGFNAYCAACHGQFHGTGNTVGSSATAFIRHPTSGIVRVNTPDTILGGTSSANPVLSLVRPAWTSTLESGNFEVACVTCHKGHGNANGYALLLPPAPTSPGQPGAAPTGYENGGGDQIRGLCVTCHPMGRF